MTQPLPIADELSRPFFEALCVGTVQLQACNTCGAWQLGRELCWKCRSEDLAWRPSGGRGRVHAFTWMHAVFSPAFAALAPYAVAQVELDEGPRLLGLINADAATLKLGLRVKVVAVEMGPGAFAPVFEIVGETEQ
ncbi:Zn-ribbon domain-containing OB-fold protein [Phenylobacterium sp. J367]|uniref:Zn-ribbon domain-containing OB-fold protein n=1 Tax=Phenylobacterium sp. J367 TaxID=2898435 RepID=UPI0021514EDD|nr:OB-fold domain-containing protein [Phenylobacterium sp. J367]MCR5879862.1 OB-fold domain-containing protein [Phenylobacterium sp. J367]